MKNAPLKIQFQWGYEAFSKGILTTKIKRNTMQYREWQRGWNTAYFDNLKGIRNGNKATTRNKKVA